MWALLSERARKAVYYAQEEAGRLSDNYVSTEHLGLGIIREEDNRACWVIRQLGFEISHIRAAIEGRLVRGMADPAADMQLTPRGKRVIDLAYNEARQLNHDCIGTEHLLLGIIAESQGLGGLAMRQCGITLEAARYTVASMRQNVWPPPPSVNPPPMVVHETVPTESRVDTAKEPQRRGWHAIWGLLRPASNRKKSPG